MVQKIFVATQAFIINDDKILIIRESPTYEDGTNIGKFGVPGGRVKAGERFDAGLRREVKEETGLSVNIGEPFFVGEWRPMVRGEERQIVGVFFECTSESDKVTLGNDHDEYLWIDPRGYKNFNLIENLFSAFETYLKFVRTKPR